LASFDQLNDCGNDSFINFSRLCVISTQQHLKEAHLQLLKLQQNLSNAPPQPHYDIDEEEVEDDDDVERGAKKQNDVNHKPNQLVANPSHEIEHWKLSVHKLLDQIRDERKSFHEQHDSFETKHKHFFEELTKSQETTSRLHSQLQQEKEQTTELKKQLCQVQLELQNKSKPSNHSSPHTRHANSQLSSAPNGQRSHQSHHPPFHQMSSLSESSGSSGHAGPEINFEEQHISPLQNLSANELFFVYHRDVASARAEVSVLSQELLESGRREENLTETILKLKEKLSIAQVGNHYPNTSPPINRRVSRRSFSSSLSRSYSLSPSPYSPTTLPLSPMSPHLSNKLTKLYSSEMSHILQELESKHQEELKGMIEKLHEKLNNLYEENNGLRVQLHQMKQDNYKMTKRSHELHQEKVSLENSLESRTKTMEHYKSLYFHLSSPSSRQVTNPTVSSSDGTSPLSPLSDEEEEGDDSESSCLPNNQTHFLKEKNQLNETILTLENEKQNLLNELYEHKKRNSDLIFRLKQNEMKYLSELDITAPVSPLVSVSSFGKYPLRKSMSLM
jgi:hypothetical protein